MREQHCQIELRFTIKFEEHLILEKLLTNSEEQNIEH
jgi:hypothetical protein